MHIKYEQPPKRIWDEAHRLFEIDDTAVLYTYGDTLYNPGKIQIPNELIIHEEVHHRQQESYDGGPDAWWTRYFTDAEFRFLQEAEAYGAQYRYACMHMRDRNWRARYIHDIATILASDLYKLGITRHAAQLAIMA